MYLEDDDFVHYKNGELHFFSSKKAGAALPREFEQLEMTLESLSKGNYDHFMLKEIYEQSESVVSTMRGRVDFSKNTAHLGGFTETNIRNVLSSRRILFISCGTSLNSCNAVRPLWEELIDIPVTVENASDFIDREPQIRRDDTCIFVSQSGETADTLTALKHCRAGGALCIGVTNVVGSSISRGTDFGAHLNAGVEVGVASTKAYTSQVVLMTVVALLLSRDSVSRQERRESIFIGLASLSKVISETLRDTFEPIKDVAKHLKDAKSVLVLGRGYDFSTCMEGALKIKELSYVHTEGINSGELKHGPLALIDENIPVVAVCTKDKHFEKSKAAIQQIHARKGRIIAISTVSDDEELKASTESVLQVPQTVDCIQPIINVIPLQLLAYFMALERGNNVDCPRNLAKSVTVQ
ncbi:glucosamine--fructose-6-phosphate aminotransferase (isomerizing) [Angomonas deanei]|nr:glucosamine--fructose-6-phosphate aminotransferase (isomerizing) [Angomonas deanei]|eukprot:EPY28389.1 glucosamine--fructose-6-phosphate aminotransferase (isomerizing) [Angomonas deanei]